MRRINKNDTAPLSITKRLSDHLRKEASLKASQGSLSSNEGIITEETLADLFPYSYE